MTIILVFHWMKPQLIDDLYDLINCFENDKDPVAFDIHQDDELEHIPASLTTNIRFLNTSCFQYPS